MEITIRKWSDLNSEDKLRIIKRSEEDILSVYGPTQDIIEDVRTHGVGALVRLTARFDSADIGEMPILVSDGEYAAAEV